MQLPYLGGSNTKNSTIRLSQYLYIKFLQTSPHAQEKIRNKKTFYLLRKLLFFIPQANPDFDSKIDDVVEWQLEIDSDNLAPVRELGLDANQQVIVAMPSGRNFGYWTDNNLKLEDFTRLFSAVELNKAEFITNWNKFLGR